MPIYLTTTNPTVPGPSRGMKGAFDVFSFAFGASVTVSIGGGGGGTSKLVLQSVQLTMPMSQEALDLVLNMTEAKHFQDLDIFEIENTGPIMNKQRLTFKTALFSDFQYGASSDGPGVLELTFAYQHCLWSDLDNEIQFPPLG